MTTFDELAQRYINTWNETDPNARDAWSSSPPPTPYAVAHGVVEVWPLRSAK